MHCNACGSDNCPDGARFCPFCRAPLIEDSQSTDEKTVTAYATKPSKKKPEKSKSHYILLTFLTYILIVVIMVCINSAMHINPLKTFYYKYALPTFNYILNINNSNNISNNLNDYNNTPDRDDSDNTPVNNNSDTALIATDKEIEDIDDFIFF